MSQCGHYTVSSYHSPTWISPIWNIQLTFLSSIILVTTKSRTQPSILHKIQWLNYFLTPVLSLEESHLKKKSRQKKGMDHYEGGSLLRMVLPILRIPWDDFHEILQYPAITSFLEIRRFLSLIPWLIKGRWNSLKYAWGDICWLCSIFMLCPFSILFSMYMGTITKQKK